MCAKSTEPRTAAAASFVTRLSHETSVLLPLGPKSQEPLLSSSKNIPAAHECRVLSESLAATSRWHLSGLLAARCSCSALPDYEKSLTIVAPSGARSSLRTRLLE